MSNEDRWINVSPKSKKLNLRFRAKGFKKQFFLSTGLRDTKPNREKARALRDRIENDIFFGDFDPTLERYKAHNSKSQERTKKQEEEVSIGSLWRKYTVFKSKILEPSTIKNYEYYQSIINNLPTTKLKEAPAIRDYLLSNYSYVTSEKLINQLSSCCAWGISAELISNNPFAALKLPKRKKSSREELAAYTIDQRDLIIQAFENHSVHSHYASLIKFLFLVGCRPGEAFALTWDDISSDRTKISISKAYASRVRRLKGTKNGNRRIFSCAAGGKLHSLLMSICPNHQKQDLLFTTKSGLRVTQRHLDKIWWGNSTKGRFYPGVVTELSQKGIVPYLKPYSTRHTFATWAIASGISPDKVAYWLGDSIQTVLTYYCHPEVSKSDCPDF